MNFFVALLFMFSFFSEVYLLESNYIKNYIKPVRSKLWAVLVAGSDGWSNYRHQADICHAYQVLHGHGVPDERIVVMMTDDLAHNEENPTPGIVINHPNGSDVYKGVPHDYTGEDVTPENFMAVLRGDKKALKGIGSGKVLHSGPNDHVFVFFADHGSSGIIAFPDSELTAQQLSETIKFMHDHQMYQKMVVYIEACESGSMFEGILPDNINVFATTAANSEESSYACYFDSERSTYLGDVYSVNWMEDSDKENLKQETLAKQYKIVKKETNTSHVQEFGDFTISKLHVSEFQGKKGAPPITYPKISYDAVRSRDVPLHVVRQKLLQSTDKDEQHKLYRKLEKMIRNRKFLSGKVQELLDALSTHDKNIPALWDKRLKVKDFECYDEVRKHFQEECFKISKNQYALDFMYILVNLCEYGVDPSIQKAAMEDVCTHPPVYGIH